MKDIPGPADILEELGGKVLVQIDRSAVTSFRIALDEMVDFHKFLIEAYETTDENGKPFSLAQIGGWGPQHADWIREYRRIFERAVEAIGRESDFIEVLAHLPMRLLPRDARGTTPEVTINLLDLSSFLVHRLEAWVTHRLVREAPTSQDTPPILQLPGSDARAYEDVVVRLVGAWESTLALAGSIYGWRSPAIVEEEQWRRFAASWPFLQRHLRNTAYLLAVAAWNEDEIGTRYFGEAVVRWFAQLEHQLPDPYHFPKTLHTPALLNLDWSRAQIAMTPLLFAPELDVPKPASAFAAILKNFLKDTRVILAGVMLDWFMQARQTTDISARAVSRLLLDAPGVGTDNGATTFSALMVTLIRIDTAGGRFEDDGYGAVLDGLVSFFDGMTERRVVPGRVYRPSTRRERQDLTLPWLVCLLAVLAEADDDSRLAEKVGRLTEDEDAFPDGDASLRGMLFTFQQMKGFLDAQHHAYLARGLAALRPDASFDALVARLIVILDGCITTVEAQRLERLRSRAIDPGKLERLRQDIERQIAEGTGGIGILAGHKIRRVPGVFAVREGRHRIEKGHLVTPPMLQEPGNMWESITANVRDYAVGFVWNDFFMRARRLVDVRDAVGFWAVLKTESGALLSRGKKPILLVREWRDPAWMFEWFRRADQRPPDMQVSRMDGMPGGYLGTINGVDVYRGDAPVGQSLLFPASLLESVEYGVDTSQRVVQVEFEEGADRTPGNLVFRFSQRITWVSDEIVALTYQTPASSDGQEP